MHAIDDQIDVPIADGIVHRSGHSLNTVIQSVPMPQFSTHLALAFAIVAGMVIPVQAGANGRRQRPAPTAGWDDWPSTRCLRRSPR